MSNERGWKNGVYNPGFPPDKAYMERKVKEFREAGIEFPVIKGVRLRQSKPRPLRNAVSRVVMVGFDPFNQSGLPEHVERQVVHDYLMAEERAFVQAWVNQATDGEVRFGAIIG